MDTQSVLRTWNTFWYLLCANEKINESRSKYALTTSLTLNYSFMLKCCKRSPIIWFNENACNGMHAANKLICTSYFNSIYWEVLWLYIFAVWSLFIQKHYNVNFSYNWYVFSLLKYDCIFKNYMRLILIWFRSSVTLKTLHCYLLVTKYAHIIAN